MEAILQSVDKLERRMELSGTWSKSEFKAGSSPYAILGAHNRQSGIPIVQPVNFLQPLTKTMPMDFPGSYSASIPDSVTTPAAEDEVHTGAATISGDTDDPLKVETEPNQSAMEDSCSAVTLMREAKFPSLYTEGFSQALHIPWKRDYTVAELPLDSFMVKISLSNLRTSNMTLCNFNGNQANNFEGSIPSSLGSCQKLLVLCLYNNKLSGNVPRQVIGICSISLFLAVSNNVLTGPLPDDVGNLQSLTQLVLSVNNFSGVIPSSLGKCVILELLHLPGNSFDGAIPQSFEGLRGLEDIDLSRNNLSGKIPEFNLSACTTRKVSSSRKSLVLKKTIPLASTLVLVILLSCFLAFFLTVNRARTGSQASAITLRNFTPLEIAYLELARWIGGFYKENLCGSRSFGSVYKRTLANDGAFIAAKVLDLQQRGASRSFID